MIRRLLDVLQQGMAEQMPHHPMRPNELSRQVVRAERLRREAQATARQRSSSPVEEEPRRERQASGPAPRAGSAPLAASLKSRSELRRAMLLKEILGPPAALRWPRDGDPTL